MGFLKEYAISIIVVSVLAILFENLLPQTSHKKYINVVIGLVVMLVIVSPLTKLPHYKEAFSLPFPKLDDSNFSQPDQKNLVAAEFEKRLALKLGEEIHSKFGSSPEIRVTSEVGEDGTVTGVRGVQISPVNDEIKSFVGETLGIPQELITGEEG